MCLLNLFVNVFVFMENCVVYVGCLMCKSGFLSMYACVLSVCLCDCCEMIALYLLCVEVKQPAAPPPLVLRSEPDQRTLGYFNSSSFGVWKSCLEPPTHLTLRDL